MSGLAVALIYLVPFVLLGLVARLAANRWMVRRSLGLGNLRAMIGPRREKRRAFLLGAWREEDPD